MASLPVGLITFFSLVAFIFLGGDASIFLNAHAILIVVVGSFAILAISSPTRAILGLARVFQLIFSRDQSTADLDAALITISKKKTAKVATKHPLIVYTQSLWEQGLEPSTTNALMKQKFDQLNSETASAIMVLRNLAKYPPALGMMGTVLGIIALFSGLSPGAQSKIGPGLAVAMTSTFYGLLMANAVLMPLADRIQAIHQQKVIDNRYVLRILTLIHSGQPALLVEEEIHGKAA